MQAMAHGTIRPTFAPTETTCGPALAPVNTHTTFSLQSGTGGLQEALNTRNGKGPATIVLSQEWYKLISNISNQNATLTNSVTPADVITNATCVAGETVVDVTTVPWTQFGCNASGKLIIETPAPKPSVAAGTGAGTGPTIAIVAGSSQSTGTVTLTSGTAPAASGGVFTVTFPAPNYGGGFAYAPTCTVTSVGATNAYTSGVVTSTAGSGTTAPTATTCTFSGGIDGVSTPATVVTNLIGVDTTPRTGMYALRGQGCSIAVLADLDTSTTWTTQDAFGLSEGIYMILTGPLGDTIANAVTTKQTAGLDDYACKLMFGDWLLWSDQANGVLRYVSPQGFVAGRLANLSPEQSSLNKPLYSIAGSQKQASQNGNYSSAELAVLAQAGIDVITNPGAGNVIEWTVRIGHNSSSNAAKNGDNYTRLTNYIAATLNAGMGAYVGQVINTQLFKNIRATQLSFLQAMLDQGLLGSTNGKLPFSVICDTSNNPDNRTGLGYVQSDAAIRYQAINEKFIVNMQGGTTVAVSRQAA